MEHWRYDRNSKWASINATGGTGTFEYSIDGGLTYQIENLFNDLDPGMYTILIMDENGCTSECGPINAGPNGLNDQENSRTVLSPNPATNQMTILYETSSESFTIFEVKSIAGEVIHSIKATTTKGENTFSINTSNYSNGAYYLVIYTEKGVQSKPFIVMK